MEDNKDQVEGGLADKFNPESIAALHGVTIDQIADQIAKGIKVELEHTDDEKLAREIAMDHLVEDPAYYDKLAKIEKPMEESVKLKMFDGFLTEDGGAPEGAATLDATPGMGAPVLASRGVVGSGDVATVANAKKKRKKKVKGFDDFFTR